MELEAKQNCVIRILNTGRSYKQIMSNFNVNEKFIWRMKKVVQETGSTSRRPGQRRKQTVKTL